MFNAAAVRSSKADTSQTFTRQGSLRRVLPSEHNKENIFNPQDEFINMFYKLVHQEYIILAEYKMLISENVKSIYMVPSENSLVWFGVIFVRSGLYEDGIFRFSIMLPDSFPDCEHPKVVFESKMYHPVISEDTSELCLSKGFPTWNKAEQHVWQVVKYIHWNFYNFEACIAHAVNQEAVDLYKENLDAFKLKIKECIELSQEQLYNSPPTNDKHYLTFEKYVAELHDPVRASMIADSNEEPPVKMGHSWVMPGSFKPLSRVPPVVTENDC